MTHPEHVRDEDADKLHRLRERDPELDRLTGHVRKFAAMMTGRHGDRLESWIADAEQDNLAPWRPSPATSAAISTLSATACPCPTVPAPWRATSTG
ncbi:hypothetical protein [Streptomyces sp. NPDC049887]|uniref:hypothetical protein n=1 Tax=Streptomyces sp. NPDC049887 TaxID=3155654 RepID=UPI0034159B45